jgi:type I site-specific restriction endonuclease
MQIDTQTLMIVLVGVAAFAVLLQAAVLIAILVAIVKAAKMASAKTDDLRTSVIPVLERSHELLEATQNLVARIDPRLDAAAADLASITHTAREQVGRLEAVANEIQTRVHHHVARLDNMATAVLDTVDYAGRTVSGVVRRPARHVSGVVAAARAFAEKFSNTAPRKAPASGPVRERSPKPDPEPAHEDKNVTV